MRRILSFALLGTATLLAGAPTAKTKPPSKHAATNKAAMAKTTGRASSHYVGTGKTRGRRSASGRALRVPPPPSYQLHPDPERYQQIQQALADRGYFKGEVNGTWGDDSTDALRKFQADQKLPDDGKITALSLTSLGLGPRHDGSTASTVPVPAPDPPGTVAAPQSTTPPELLDR